MDWDKQTILRFLELYQMNSCIWDPHNEYHKNRQRVYSAWADIRDNLGVPCTISDLKRKKESLMSAYRGYKHKIKNSEESGATHVYQPTWFAFAYMDSFLGSVYTCNTNISDADTTTTNSSVKRPISSPLRRLAKRKFYGSSSILERSLREKKLLTILDALHDLELDKLKESITQQREIHDQTLKHNEEKHKLEMMKLEMELDILKAKRNEINKNNE